ncbi:hypothetical protein L1887_47825 [Cichorium endivia]|nr:hypothetical protein L1887_47825 [Cichorium endivia]
MQRGGLIIGARSGVGRRICSASRLRAAAMGSKQNALPIARIFGCWFGRQHAASAAAAAAAAAAASPPAKLPKIAQSKHRRTDHSWPDALRCSSACLPSLSGLIADDEARLFSSTSRSAARVGCERFHLHFSTASWHHLHRLALPLRALTLCVQVEVRATLSRRKPFDSTAAPSAGLGFRNQHRLDCLPP